MEFWSNPIAGIGAAALDGLRTLCYWLDTMLYKLIIYLYNLFEKLCNGEILSSDIIETISSRVGLILGVFMFFMVAISFIRMILDPDKINDKEIGTSSIVKKVILVVVMLGVSSTVFEFSYDVQKVILGNNSSESNVIQNFFLPYKVDTMNFGPVLSQQLLLSFYHIDYDLHEQNSDNQEFNTCNDYQTALKNQILVSKEFSLGYNCLNEKFESSYTIYSDGKAKEYVMKFESILSVVAGAVIAYMLFIYCINVGVRMVQLAFLQIISPMAIISYLAPSKDSMFSKWGKIYISTYIDVFIRVAIINLIVYIIALILDDWNTMSGVFWTSMNTEQGSFTQGFIGIVIIIALLNFAKRAPQLLQEILPKGGPGSIGFGISTKDMVGLGAVAGGLVGLGVGTAGRLPGVIGNGVDNVKNAKGFMGKTKALAGSIFGGAGSLALGGFSGLARGGKAGFSAGGLGKAVTGSQSAVAKANLARAQRIASGTTIGETVGDSVRGLFGMQSNYTYTDSRLSAFNNLNSLINDEDIVKDYVSQRETASKALGTAQAAYDGDDSDANLAALNRAKDAFYQADARVGAAKDAVFEAFSNNTSVSDITFDWVDSAGNTHNGVTERALSEIKPNASGVAALDNVQRVSGTDYKNRKSFNNDRKRLQAESQTRHKNG